MFCDSETTGITFINNIDNGHFFYYLDNKDIRHIFFITEELEKLHERSHNHKINIINTKCMYNIGF